jgi:acetylornithine deacetylase/succinyl-diaminopimelate desuccinylase-like protein
LTIEVLLEKGFKPTRTVVFSFGFDEEAGGYQVCLLFSLPPPLDLSASY